jgi:hypothetical protein
VGVSESITMMRKSPSYDEVHDEGSRLQLMMQAAGISGERNAGAFFPFNRMETDFQLFITDFTHTHKVIGALSQISPT